MSSSGIEAVPGDGATAVVPAGAAAGGGAPAFATPAEGPGPAGAVLLDLFQLVGLVSVLGLVVFALVRKASPLSRWPSHGNVFTGPFGAVDLLAVAALFLLYYALNFWTGGPPAGDAGEPAGVGGLTGDQALALVVADLVWKLALGTCVVFYLRSFRGIDLHELYGTRRLRPRRVLRDALIGVLVVAYPAAIAFGYLNRLLTERAGLEGNLQLPVEMFARLDGFAFRSLFVVSAVLVAPVVEEVIFRGFIYPVCKRFSDRFFATLISAAIFALVHNDLGALLPLFALGICFAAAFELTGSLVVAIVMHALFNLLNLILIVVATAGGELPDLPP